MFMKILTITSTSEDVSKHKEREQSKENTVLKIFTKAGGKTDIRWIYFETKNEFLNYMYGFTEANRGNGEVEFEVLESYITPFRVGYKKELHEMNSAVESAYRASRS